MCIGGFVICHPMKSYFMKHLYCLLIATIVINAAGAVAQERVGPPAVKQLAGSELSDYIALPDDSFRWELRERQSSHNCEILRLHLTSQRWQGIDWRHILYLIKPQNLDVQRDDAVLVVAGGSWQMNWPENGPDTVSVRGEVPLMANVAQQFGCVIAVLTMVPFQPMMNGKHEDEIIAATFAKYVETQDATWPLLLPMVKSAVRGMDATCSAAKQEWGVTLNKFTVTGASKRGWTTWLTGATDPRVTAIAPMVIDMLNMGEQMKHQVASFGGYSEQIADYTELNLPAFLSTPQGQSLQKIVDPFAYREQLTLPKLLIFGTNDRYWPLDACNLYWDQLSGDKHLLYVPNQGHGLNDYPRVLGSVMAIHRSRNGGKPLPQLDWNFADEARGIKLDISAKGAVDSVRGWVAQSPTRDFRDAKWSEKVCKQLGNGSWTLEVAKPQDGFVACFAECVGTADSMPSFFSTNVRIFAAP